MCFICFHLFPTVLVEHLRTALQFVLTQLTNTRRVAWADCASSHLISSNNVAQRSYQSQTFHQKTVFGSLEWQCCTNFTCKRFPCRSRHRPTNQSFRVCKVNLATPMVAIIENASLKELLAWCGVVWCGVVGVCVCGGEGRRERFGVVCGFGFGMGGWAVPSSLSLLRFEWWCLPHLLVQGGGAFLPSPPAPLVWAASSSSPLGRR